jgi:hypothetical protein
MGPVRQDQRINPRASFSKPRTGVQRLATVATRPDEQHDPRAVGPDEQ